MSMGEDFRNRLKDGNRTAGIDELLGEQCDGCDRVFDPGELFGIVCEDCTTAELWYGYGPDDDDNDPAYDATQEYTFVRDHELV